MKNKYLPPHQKGSETSRIIYSKVFWCGGLIKISLIVIALIIFLYLGNNNFFQKNSSKAVIDGKEFKLEVVSNNKERERGLGGRESLCENCGMLFDFKNPGKYSFWMKDMKFTLDIIWISGNEIVYIAKDVSPNYQETIISQTSADKVLELNGGTCEKFNFKIGDKIEF
jgi:uncharacterized membrane protein (UPF0127 family)